MSGRPKVFSALRCIACNRSLTTSIRLRNGVQIPNATGVRLLTTTAPSAYPRKRPFARSNWDPTTELEEAVIENHQLPSGTEPGPLIEWSAIPPAKEESVRETETAKENAPRTASNRSLPWYLQVQSSQKRLDEDHPLAERQRLPELPPDPPPMLQPLFEYASVDLGLDNLSLLDLRNLDPPPALGANLLMIIGSTRSEKHLHVSADRFCRWLRSNYKLTPFADGLLGRNELKLKRRRKNRRSKMLATVGAVERADMDDGISTGWICVHAGQIEPAESATQEEVEQNFVGFGERSDSVTLVVQLFTEEKRAESDLEGLWGDILERSVRKQKHKEAAERGEIEEYLDDVKPDSDKLKQAHLSGRIPLTPLHTIDGLREGHAHR